MANDAELKEFCDRFQLASSDVQALCERHGVDPCELDAIPHPTDAAVYVSYGPEDEDVELLECADE